MNIPMSLTLLVISKEAEYMIYTQDKAHLYTLRDSMHMCVSQPTCKSTWSLGCPIWAEMYAGVIKEYS